MTTQSKAGDPIRVNDILWSCELTDTACEAGDVELRFHFKAILVSGVGDKRVTYQRYDPKTQQAHAQTHMDARLALGMARSRTEAAGLVVAKLKREAEQARRTVTQKDREHAWAVLHLEDVHDGGTAMLVPKARAPKVADEPTPARESRYWLSVSGVDWREVTEAEFIAAERSAGFRPKPGCGPVATGGFSSGPLRGRVAFDRPEGEAGKATPVETTAGSIRLTPVGYHGRVKLMRVGGYDPDGPPVSDPTLGGALPSFVTDWYRGTDTLKTKARRDSIRVLYETGSFAVFYRPGYSQGGDYAPAETVMLRKGVNGSGVRRGIADGGLVSGREAILVEGRSSREMRAELIESARSLEVAEVRRSAGRQRADWKRDEQT